MYTQNVHVAVYSSIIYNSQKVESTEVSINWQMDNYYITGILFSIKKERNTDTFCHIEMDLKNILLVK